MNQDLQTNTVNKYKRVELDVIRYGHSKKSTLSLFAINKKFSAYCIEDAFHVVKIPGKTRIPNGTYKVIFRTTGGHHERYKKKFPDMHKGMLHVIGVPNYKYILIHIGNTEDDTEGCLLPGDVSVSNIKASGRVENSTIAYKRIYPIIADALEAGEDVFINYKDIAL